MLIKMHPWIRLFQIWYIKKNTTIATSCWSCIHNSYPNSPCTFIPLVLYHPNQRSPLAYRNNLYVSNQTERHLMIYNSLIANRCHCPRASILKAADPDLRQAIGRDGHLDQSRAQNLNQSLWEYWSSCKDHLITYVLKQGLHSIKFHCNG